MPGPDISTGARGEPACSHASMPEVPSGVGPDTSGRAGGVDDAEGAPAARDVSAEVSLQELTADEQPGAGGVRKANVKKGEWRKRGTKARGAEGAETETLPWVRCDEAPQSVPSSHGTGVHLNVCVCVCGRSMWSSCVREVQRRDVWHRVERVSSHVTSTSPRRYADEREHVR